MNNPIDIEVVIDSLFRDPKVTIQTERRTQEIDNIIYAIENCAESDYPVIKAYDGSAMELIAQRDIWRIYYENKRLMMRAENGVFQLRNTIAEMEVLLNKNRFIRISRSEIVNLKKIKRFEFSMTGTVGIVFDDDSRTWTARRYVKKIRDTLAGL